MLPPSEYNGISVYALTRNAKEFYMTQSTQKIQIVTKI